jgi:hypothetical protein
MGLWKMPSPEHWRFLKWKQIGIFFVDPPTPVELVGRVLLKRDGIRVISHASGAGGRVHTNLALTANMCLTFGFTLWPTLTINCTLYLMRTDRVRACLRLEYAGSR